MHITKDECPSYDTTTHRFIRKIQIRPLQPLDVKNSNKSNSAAYYVWAFFTRISSFPGGQVIQFKG